MEETEKLWLAVTELRKDMETGIRHDKKFNSSIDNLEFIVADFKLSLSLFKEQNKNIPERVRILEDKSIVTEFVKVAGWFIVGAFISAFVMQSFTATKENQDYSIQKSK